MKKWFKRKPKCQRKNKDHIIDLSLRCIYCGKIVIDLGVEFYKKHRREISKKLYYAFKKHREDEELEKMV